MSARCACPRGRSRQRDDDDDELRRLTLEQLLEVEISTVSRMPESLLHASAAVTVLTREDMLRSGATTLADALRLVPGVHVAQIDSNKWALGIRGFADRLSRSMLVMIDGRAVYSPLFAGTYWEVQDTLLDDVERVEVVRGPGGHAVGRERGQRHRQRRHAAGSPDAGDRSPRPAPAASSGDSARSATAGSAGRRRIAAMRRPSDAALATGPTDADFDEWRMGQGGFRTDTALAGEAALTVQGDVYAGWAGQRLNVTTYTPPFSTRIDDRADLAGGNLLGRWTTGPDAGRSTTLQAYYDFTSRREAVFEESRHTVDLDFQQSRAPGEMASAGVGGRVPRHPR